MTISPAVLRAMQAAGASTDIIIAAIEADAAQDAERVARQVPWPRLRIMAFERDGQVCKYCETTEGPFEIDHVVPRANGGEDTLENVVVSCRGCNRAKKDREGDEWELIRQRRERDRDRKRRDRSGQSKPVRGQSTDKRTSSPEVSPNDIYSNPHPNPTSDAEASRQPLAEKVVEAWNEGPAKRGATGAKPLDAGRRKALTQRVREHTEAEVFEAIRNIGASDFHCGKNDRGWTANIGWLLKSPENFQKALELQPRTALPSQSANDPIDLVQHILRRGAA